jgi:hypothetical protein
VIAANGKSLKGVDRSEFAKVIVIPSAVAASALGTADTIDVATITIAVVLSTSLTNSPPPSLPSPPPPTTTITTITTTPDDSRV